MMADFFGAMVSIAIGVLAGMGMGSGGLFMLYLTLGVGLPHKAAQGINLLFVVFALGGAFLVHVRNYRLPWRILLFILAAGIPGAILGSIIVLLIPVSLLRPIFGLFLIISGVVTLFRSKSKNKRANEEKKESECLTNREETDIM